MNGLAPGLDGSRLSCKVVDKANNPILCLSASYLFWWDVFLKMEWGRKATWGLSCHDYQ